MEKAAATSYPMSAFLVALEQERAELARSLRCETVQVLASVLVGLSRVERLDDVQEIRSSLGALREVVRADLERVERCASEIRPSVLDDFGLAAAVRATAASLQSSGGGRITVEWAEDTRQRLTHEQEALLFRIVQEALQNALSHAAAQKISVRTHSEECGLRVEVHDDGRGFNAEGISLESATGNGLRLMQAHAQALGGRLDVASRPGRGTTVRLRLT